MHTCPPRIPPKQKEEQMENSSPDPSRFSHTGVWGGMRAGFAPVSFLKFAATKKFSILICLKFWCNIIVVIDKWILHYNVNLLMMICQQVKI